VPSDAEVILDREELRNITLDDRQLMSEILWALIDDANRHAGAIESAIRERDPARAVRIARFAGRACANVGAGAAAESFRRVERLAASGAFDACRDRMAELRKAIDQLRKEAARIP
jgi:HPt (histidine-containing phosphotransfer) domain-containing protein